MKNKELTKKKLIIAVGEIIKTEGFDSLKSASKIARKAEVDRKLINRYFGGLNQLIEAYIVENDYWLLFTEKINGLLKSNNYPGIKELITSILQNQFTYFSSDKDMQRLILWELTTSNPLMKSIHNARESMGQKILEITDDHFNGSKVNFRAISALLVGGIYYTILHTIYNGGTFSDLNITSNQGQEHMLTAIEQIVGWAYEEAENSK
ncbi:TetR/AcrR family transcriptional regulator [Mucilaginibacter sp. FT3.2]|uniref:TetR/AcrR family transcriptional regulator n=1 Tax=Mucilaginibacter sp. FT3.2 TaxID=2723090 RepID=UPI00161C2339|nr:TetR/AcrR family transcriptional regulator [Mucilaginibacter sp. FT3.2]MBB6232494.1 AcrR family transcriptional regulator [Mucilaginibacter sp. FT3.2]